MNQFDIQQSQPKIWSKLNKSIENNKIGSAYLFSGHSGVGKEAMAIEFGAVINRNFYQNDKSGAEASYRRFKNLQHELLKIVVPLPVTNSKKSGSTVIDLLSSNDLELLNQNIAQKSKNPFHKICLPNASRILINSIRELRKTLYLKSTDIGRKMVLIFDAHLLCAGQAESANALLKLLEEPPPNATIILATDNKNLLLPTILSRCQHIDFPPLSQSIIKKTLLEDSVDEKAAEFIAYISQGNMRQAIQISSESAESLLQKMQELVTRVIYPDGSKWRKFISENSQLARTDLQQFQLNFFLLQIWFKTAYLQRIGASDSLQSTKLHHLAKNFNQQFPKADLQKIDILLEETMVAIGLNLHMPLILTNLLINIQKHLIYNAN